MTSKTPTKFSSQYIASRCNIFYFNQENGWKIGYVTSNNILTSQNIILICPGLTGFAIPFIEWFWPLYHPTKIGLVSIDWRGFGLSKSNISINTKIYPDLTISYMASDLVKLVNNYIPKHNKLFLLGHSHGILCALLALQQNLANRVSGFINLDESLMNVPQTHAMDLSYPIKSTFSWDTIQNWINDYQYQDKDGNFSRVKPALLKQFTIPGFAETEYQLHEWMQYTDNINGNVLAFIFKQDMTIDLTSIITTILLKYQIPVFVYVGEGSIVPAITQNWLYHKVKNIKNSVLYRVSANDGGYHTPFLPTALPRDNLMNYLKRFVLLGK